MIRVEEDIGVDDYHRWSGPSAASSRSPILLFGNRINKYGQKGDSSQLQLGTNLRF